LKYFAPNQKDQLRNRQKEQLRNSEKNKKKFVEPEKNVNRKFQKNRKKNPT